MNLLRVPVIDTKPMGALTLPGVLAALARDEIDSYPAMRPHQRMFWHMLCVQLAMMALNKAGRDDLPGDETAWTSLLRALTPDFPDDEPWSLIVDDWSKPAFLQPPVPGGFDLKNVVTTPDALDLPITSRNHDLKAAIAAQARAEDWIFALVSLQTGEGYSGSGNQGIARMNGGSSSRPMLTLAPLAAATPKGAMPRPGAWFQRDCDILRDEPIDAAQHGFKARDGIGLVWTRPWREDQQLEMGELDPLFIEICRRVRLSTTNKGMIAYKGTSAATRLNGKHLNGNVGDPWAPIHKTQNKNLTIGDDGDFSYRKITELVFSGDWQLPKMASRRRNEGVNIPLALVVEAIARGNSKTGGFRSRILPMSGKSAAAFFLGDGRKALGDYAREQIDEIAVFDKALGYGLALLAAKGEASAISKDKYAYGRAARDRLDRFADTIFFDHLWQRHDAADLEGREAAKGAFINALWEQTRAALKEAMPTIPCASLMRPRGEAGARAALYSRVLSAFSDYIIDGNGDDKRNRGSANAEAVLA